jgi:hypothetical protein
MTGNPHLGGHIFERLERRTPGNVQVARESHDPSGGSAGLVPSRAQPDALVESATKITIKSLVSATMPAGGPL